MKISHLPLLSYVALVGIPVSIAAQEAPTKIQVTAQVLRKAGDLEPLGLNNLGDAGGFAASSGNIITQSGFEPATLRRLNRVINAGVENGKRWVSLDGSSTSNYLQFANGSLSGARMRAYRFLDAAGQPLPYKDAGSMEGGKVLDATHVAQVRPLFNGHVLPRGTDGFPDGGWLAATPGITTYQQWRDIDKTPQQAAMKAAWRVYYDADVPLQMDDLVMFERSMVWPDAADFHPRVAEKGVRITWDAVTGDLCQVPLPADAPPQMEGGQGCLQITPAAGVGEAWFKLFDGPGQKDAFWYGTLDEGVTYRYEAWAQVVGAATGQLHLGFGGNRPGVYTKGFFGHPLGKDFTVGPKWQKVGFEFVAPATPPQGSIEGSILRYTGEGVLLVDNVKLQPVYAPGDASKPFVIYKKLFDELMADQPEAGRKGALRSWNMLSQASMDSLLGWNRPAELRFSDAIRVEPNSATPVTAKVLTIAEATGNTPETRMVPWLITQVTHSEDEYRQLVEYLAAPYDPARDSPQSKPFAYRRTLQRGNNRPWTAEFREIILEFGNENWHNRAMADWLGVGRSGTIHQAGREMGAYSKYLVGEMRNSPYWDGAKIKINFGGNYDAGVKADGSVSGYGQEAVQTGGDTATYHSHATYVGPRWEVGEASQSSVDDSGVQRTLLAYRSGLDAKEWAAQQQADEALRKLGFKVKMTAYEGGPTGFGLQAKTPAEDRAGEYYGKSYAMGTAMMDAWLDAWAKGWTYQCYLSFGQGRWWASHTSFAQGHRASPGFLVQTLINHTLANRDMLSLTVTGAPVLPVPDPVRGKKYLPGDTVPTRDAATIQAHAFADANSLAVAVVNLNLEKDQAVDLEVPLASAQKITLHTLTGGPRATNLDELKVSLAQSEVPVSVLVKGHFKTIVPAGSPLVVVFGK